MGIGPRLELRQTQNLVMTPQLRQAIKLLQFSNIEVAAFIEEELERNPLLERDDTPDIPPERPALDQRIDGAATPDGELAAADGLLDSGLLPADHDAPLDTDPAEQFDAASWEGAGSGGNGSGGPGAEGPGAATSTTWTRRRSWPHPAAPYASTSASSFASGSTTRSNG